MRSSVVAVVCLALVVMLMLLRPVQRPSIAQCVVTHVSNETYTLVCLRGGYERVHAAQEEAPGPASAP